MSARWISVSTPVPCAGWQAMPMLASTSSVRPSIENGSRRPASSWRATTLASPGRRRAGSSTPNSSPPRRATVSRSPSDCLEAVRDLLQQAVARVVAERVVDLLEVIEVDQHHGRGHVRAAAGGDRLLDAVAEERAVGQAGERVVQRLVLLGDRRAPAAVDGEERQQQQQQRRQAELGRQHHDGRETEQQARGRGLEEEVVGQVAAELDDALRERDDGRDERAVDDEEDRRDAEDRDQVLRPERQRAGRLGDVREHQQQRGGADRDRVLRRVEGDLLDRLAVDRVGQDARRRAGRPCATAGPPASISASAKQVEVVTSPSDPRVWTFSGTSSPDEGAEGEEGQLRIEELVEGVESRAEHEHRASGARGDHQRHVEVEWVVSAGARDRVSVEGVGDEGALPRQPHMCGGRGHPRAHHLRPFLAFMRFPPS